MPNIRSAKKRMRSDAKKHLKNLAAISELKTFDKKIRLLTQDPAQAEAMTKQAISGYDRAVSRGIIPRGRADRKKSRLMAFLAKIKTKP